MWRVYKITNKTYDEKEKCYKSYIGITSKTVERRFFEHCQSNKCTAIYAAIKKYGQNNWTLEILEDNIKTEKKAFERESFYILKYNTLVKNRKGYNIILFSSRKIIDGKVKCTKCGEYKNIDLFYKNKNYDLGLYRACKNCTNEKLKISRNKPKNKENRRKYREKNKSTLAYIKSKKSKELSQNNKNLSAEERYNKKPTKLCFNCKQIKPTTEFGIRNRKADGFSSYCKECLRNYNNMQYKKKQLTKKNSGG